MREKVIFTAKKELKNKEQGRSSQTKRPEEKLLHKFKGRCHFQKVRNSGEAVNSTW
jgi:hypothetical protein